MERIATDIGSFSLVPDWIADSVSPNALAVFIALYRFASRSSNQAWPSVPTLAAKAKLSENPTRAALKELVEIGAIKRERRTENGAEISSIYTVCVMRPSAHSDQGGMVQNLKGGGSESEGGVVQNLKGNNNHKNNNHRTISPPTPQGESAAEKEKPKSEINLHISLPKDGGECESLRFAIVRMVRACRWYPEWNPEMDQVDSLIARATNLHAPDDEAILDVVREFADYCDRKRKRPYVDPSLTLINWFKRREATWRAITRNREIDAERDNRRQIGRAPVGRSPQEQAEFDDFCERMVGSA